VRGESQPYKGCRVPAHRRFFVRLDTEVSTHASRCCCFLVVPEKTHPTAERIKRDGDFYSIKPTWDRGNISERVCSQQQFVHWHGPDSDGAFESIEGVQVGFELFLEAQRPYSPELVA